MYVYIHIGIITSYTYTCLYTFPLNRPRPPLLKQLEVRHEELLDGAAATPNLPTNIIPTKIA